MQAATGEDAAQGWRAGCSEESVNFLRGLADAVRLRNKYKPVKLRKKVKAEAREALECCEDDGGGGYDCYAVGGAAAQQQQQLESSREARLVPMDGSDCSLTSPRAAAATSSAAAARGMGGGAPRDTQQFSRQLEHNLQHSLETQLVPAAASYAASASYLGGNPLKRPRLSPSSATGFLGLAEHSYLTAVLDDFMYVFSFVDQAVMREALTHLLDGTTLPKPILSGAGADGGAWAAGGDGDGEGRELARFLAKRRDVQAYQAFCAKQAILWAGVATGALLMGSPEDAVAKYCTLAEAQLKECFDSTDEYAADAYMMLAALRVVVLCCAVLVIGGAERCCQGFMHLLLQDHKKYFRYMSFSNNLWTQLPAERRPNLRFVFLLCGMLSHVYGANDARARLVLQSLTEVKDQYLADEAAADWNSATPALLAEIDRVPTVPETAAEARAVAQEARRLALHGAPCCAAEARAAAEEARRLALHGARAAPRHEVMVSKPMKKVARIVLGTFHAKSGTALHEDSVLTDADNMARVHALMSEVYVGTCRRPACSATFRIIVSTWLLVSKLALGRYHEMLEHAEVVLAAIEEMPGLTRMHTNTHKCHFTAVVLRMFRQPAAYARLRRVYNTYSCAAPAVPPYEELTRAHFAACRTPFCSEVCDALWVRLDAYLRSLLDAATAGAALFPGMFSAAPPQPAAAAAPPQLYGLPAAAYGGGGGANPLAMGLGGFAGIHAHTAPAAAAPAPHSWPAAYGGAPLDAAPTLLSAAPPPPPPAPLVKWQLGEGGFSVSAEAQQQLQREDGACGGEGGGLLADNQEGSNSFTSLLATLPDTWMDTDIYADTSILAGGGFGGAAADVDATRC
ncbi:hypothetical protein JKP88DRAFT_296525 [Tribonema minus]|uniref:Uncharacterized protein n=1 Tax=Tribonema minus TaxID=303371 RepID=A0A836CLN1_9STRA|nr:hypothetical protein JKP88DRAFT_296525 [Tribonema minus]